MAGGKVRIGPRNLGSASITERQWNPHLDQIRWLVAALFVLKGGVPAGEGLEIVVKVARELRQGQGVSEHRPLAPHGGMVHLLPPVLLAELHHLADIPGGRASGMKGSVRGRSGRIRGSGLSVLSKEREIVCLEGEERGGRRGGHSLVWADDGGQHGGLQHCRLWLNRVKVRRGENLSLFAALLDDFQGNKGLGRNDLLAEFGLKTLQKDLHV